MPTINLRDFYPWYLHDEFVEVPDVIAAELFAGRRYEQAHARRMRRNKTTYSLDETNGTEAEVYSLCHILSPDATLDLMERHCRLCRALNSLPEIQGVRVEARYLLGMSVKDIAAAEGVSEPAVSKSIQKGLSAMKKILREG